VTAMRRFRPRPGPVAGLAHRSHATPAGIWVITWTRGAAPSVRVREFCEHSWERTRSWRSSSTPTCSSRAAPSRPSPSASRSSAARSPSPAAEMSIPPRPPGKKIRWPTPCSPAVTSPCGPAAATTRVTTRRPASNCPHRHRRGAIVGTVRRPGGPRHGQDPAGAAILGRHLRRCHRQVRHRLAGQHRRRWHLTRRRAGFPLSWEYKQAQSCLEAARGRSLALSGPGADGRAAGCGPGVRRHRGAAHRSRRAVRHAPAPHADAARELPK